MPHRAEEFEAEMTRRLNAEIYIGMSPNDYFQALAKIVIKFAAEQLAVKLGEQSRTAESPMTEEDIFKIVRPVMTHCGCDLDAEAATKAIMPEIAKLQKLIDLHKENAKGRRP